MFTHELSETLESLYFVQAVDRQAFLLQFRCLFFFRVPLFDCCEIRLLFVVEQDQCYQVSTACVSVEISGDLLSIDAIVLTCREIADQLADHLISAQLDVC